jgi:hypothetical protein
MPQRKRATAIMVDASGSFARRFFFAHHKGDAALLRFLYLPPETQAISRAFAGGRGSIPKS